MNNIITKELKKILNSFEGYIIMLVFFLINGLALWILPYPSPNILEGGIGTLQPFFQLNFYLFMLLVPIITMGLISEEKKINTLELLLTKPIPPFSIIVGKFLACFILISIIVLLSFIYLLCIYNLSSGNIDLGSIYCGYLGLFLLCFLYISIGLFCSSLTKRQFIAFLLSFSIITIGSLGVDLLIKLISNFEIEALNNNYNYSSKFIDFIQIILQKISFSENYKSFGLGILDLKSVFYFISLGFMFLLISVINIKEEK